MTENLSDFFHSMELQRYSKNNSLILKIFVIFENRYYNFWIICKNPKIHNKSDFLLYNLFEESVLQRSLKHYRLLRTLIH